MKLSTNFSVNEESFPDQTKWIGNLLIPLSSCLSQIILSLQGNLTIGDNLVGVIQEATFTTPATYTTGTFTPVRVYWKPGSLNPPATVFVGKVVYPSTQAMPITAITANVWTYDYNSQSIVINYIAGLANSSTYTLTLECK